MVVVITWLHHRVLALNKHGVHFIFLEGMFDFLTLSFSILVPPVTYFRFLILLKVAIGCSCNNSLKQMTTRFLLLLLRLLALTNLKPVEFNLRSSSEKEDSKYVSKRHHVVLMLNML